MTLESRMDFFTTNYDLISFGAYSNGPKKLISDGDSRLCRFCHKDESETTFDNVSHAIPECLGNHQLILLDECDQCNKFFAEKLEDHLDKFTRPYRVAGQIVGKNGVPSYQSNNQKNKIKFGEIPTITSRVGEEFFSVDRENKTVMINLHQETHIPLCVYKALIKIAVSVLESKVELAAFSGTINWLLNTDLTKSVIKPAVLMHTFVPGPRPTSGVAVQIFRRKSNILNVPYAIFIIGFGNVVFQLVVPSQIDSGISMTVTMPFFPSPFEFMEWPYGNLTYGSTDLSGTDKVKKDFPISYSYDEILEVDLSTETPS